MNKANILSIHFSFPKGKLQGGFFILFLLVLSACGNEAGDFNTDVAVNVSVEELKRKPFEQTMVTTGTVKPSQEFSYKSEIAGEYFLQTNPRTGHKFRMGDKVKKGDVIIKIEDEEYRNQTNIEGAKLDLDISEMEYKKQQALYEKGGVTLRELVNSEKTLVTARQAYETAKIKLAKMKVTAPFDGIITDLPYYSNGVRIETGQQLISYMEYSTVVMDMNLPENQMGKVGLKQEARIMNYSLPDDTLTGYISELSPAIDEETRSFKGRIEIKNKDLKLRPGMFVKAEIVVARRDSALVIPKDVMQSAGNRKYVFVAQRETARRRYIRTGMENNGFVEVTEGLKPGERLIIKGYETLRDRSKIKVIR
ncbi:MAG: efflux RND transporter periplasmic adaptor subunit [Chlorobi bacterium]|nr:efflux RND transporter periplasmic adaptor subunit [Chlorobiota bacterium]